MELTTPADLTEVSFDAAMELISKEFGGVSPTYTIVKVASQGLADAGYLSVRCNFAVQLSCEYQPDEWSVTAAAVTGHRVTHATVWSPGA